MNGGLLKSASAVAIFAAAGLFASAQAADLGGDCCADLEERVAELEATTVRKGNRKVALTISGFIGQQVLFWNDGTQKDMYIGDGGNIFSRFRFTGSAKVTPSVTVGFTYEFAANSTSIASMNQLNGGDKLGGSGVSSTACGGSAGNVVQASTIGCATLRDETVWIQHKELGKLKIGQGSTATDNLVLIDVAGLGSAATPDIPLYVGSFLLRGKNGQFGASSSAGTWSAAMRGHESWDTNRREHVMYETPTLAGFTLQAAVAADNYWDVALRYAGDLGGFRIAGGIGYQQDTDFNGTNQLFSQAGALCSTNCDVKTTDLKGSLSIMHIATGLFVTGAAGNREMSGTNLGTAGKLGAYTGPDARFWWLSGGISQNFFGIGKTVLFGEYGEH
ncbi:MAG: porin, partial [Proteobacteria bacterium]|nr:porin [Pseudomonadota bacterium]